MKSLGSYILLITVFLALNSCTTYYYSTIDSNDARVEKMDNGDFVEENDTLSIAYCFYGEDLPIGITVRNKLDRPLFLDWQESAVIVDETAESYVSRDMQVQGDFHSSTFSYRDYLFLPTMDYGESMGKFSGSAQAPQYVAFLPPRTRMSSTPLVLQNFEFEKIPKKEFTKQPFVSDKQNDNNYVSTVKAIRFTPDSTPLHFKSYLTFYTLKPDGSRDNMMVFEHHFYISRLIKGGTMKPSNFLANNEKRGDFFYVRKQNGSAMAIVATGVIAIGVAGAAIDLANPPHRRYR